MVAGAAIHALSEARIEDVRVRSWLAEAKNSVDVLPCSGDDGARSLLALQVPSSPLGEDVLVLTVVGRERALGPTAGNELEFPRDAGCRRDEGGRPVRI